MDFSIYQNLLVDYFFVNNKKNFSIEVLIATNHRWNYWKSYLVWTDKLNLNA